MKLYKVYPIIGLIICLFTIKIQAQPTPVFISQSSSTWADSVFKTLSYEEKIGQLFMVAAFSNRDSAHINYIQNLIDSLHIGGLLFFQGGPVRQALLTNHYQSCSRVPLMIAIDGEWGLSMRLDSTMRFPRQMTLGAGNNDSLIYLMGNEIASQCSLMGIHLNFAPVVDINNNPSNPVINSRSFGEDKFDVTRHAEMYMRGMQDKNVLACAKHFPGHGNTDTDSHYSLPVINQTAEAMDSVELFPFKQLINNRLGSLMIAHLQIPSLDSTSGQPSTLSKPIVTDLLKGKLQFGGLVFTDALDMKGVSSYYKSGELELKALIAGNDVLLNTEDVGSAVERIHYGIQNCEIDQSVIDESVRKILMAKHWCGLSHYIPINVANLYTNLGTDYAQWLNYRLYENSVTLLKNDDELIPLKPFEDKKIASVVVNDVLNNLFQQTLNNYAKVDCFSILKDASEFDVRQLYIKLKEYDRIIVSVHNTSTNASKNFGITASMQSMVNKLAEVKGTIVCIFGNPYVLTKFEEINCFETVVLAYEDTYLPQYFAAQTLFGGNSLNGRLPVTATDCFKLGTGITLLQNQAVKYTLPEEVMLNENPLDEIEKIIYKSIDDSVFPGCQLLAARDGKVFVTKAYGTPMYGDTVDVKVTDLYDIASVTKIASTALAAMWLFDKHKLNLNTRISKYLPELKRSNKTNITLGDLMAHQAGLQAWIPFYKKTLRDGKPVDSLYHKQRDDLYSIEVADSLWLRKDYEEKIWKEIIASPVDTPGHYVYSDLGLIILQHIIEKITGDRIDEIVRKHFYEPLGLWRISFKPLESFQRNEIIPTELDTTFRKQLLHGYVHDPAAAMTGGIAGHAGVFSNAQSLSVIMQLLLNGGEYGGRRYIRKETIDLFTHQAFPGSANRRGFLFDKPDPDTKNSPAARSASPLAFGHAGFTGTCAWADPKNGLIYIFLSNRVYPSASNNKLAKLNIRTDIMELFYKALK